MDRYSRNNLFSTRFKKHINKDQMNVDNTYKGRIFLSTLTINSIYYETEVEKISLLMFSMSQDLILEQFKTCIKHIVFPSKKFVFRVIGNLYLTVISSDPSDTTYFLERMLSYYLNILRFRCYIDTTGNKWSFSVERTRLMLKPMLSTLVHLMDNHQPILFNGISSIDIDRFETRSKIVQSLSTELDDILHMCHAVVFSGTRLIAVWSSPHIKWVLKPSDIICLMIYSLALKEGENYEHVYMYTSHDKQDEVSLYSTKFSYEEEPSLDSNFSILLLGDYDEKRENMEATKLCGEKIRSELDMFLSFLSVKASHKLTMKHFFQSTPGVLHFVFVDRLRGKVTAPDIVDLGNISSEFMKRIVFDMFNVISSYRTKGYHQVVLFKKELTYCFQEWIVTKENKIMEVRVKSIRDTSSVGHYELYTVYLPFVSLKGIENFNNAIMKQYCKGNV